MVLIYFLTGLAFGGLGLAAYLQMRHEGEFPLKRELPLLAAFGFAGGATGWIDMFLASGSMDEFGGALTVVRMGLQPITGLILVLFGWGILCSLGSLPSWTIFVPGVLIVPFAYVVTFAATTFITPSPLEIPIDIWSRYLLYLPGSVLAGLGFMRLWHGQRGAGIHDVSRLMLGAGIAFFLEAFVVGLVVYAAPYGPASYYNYDRVSYNAFVGEGAQPTGPFGLAFWFDYARIRTITGLPIEFWRMLSAVFLALLVIRGLGVFDAISKRERLALQAERDRAQLAAYEAQSAARQTAESWTNALVSISRHITELEDVDQILLYIVEQTWILLRSDYVGLALVSGDSTQLKLKCEADAHGSELLNTHISVENSLLQETFRTGQPGLSPERANLSQLVGTWSGSTATPKALAAVSIAIDTRPIGVFWVLRLVPEPYTETDAIWLECLADQVVIAIKHGLMTSQLQSLSVTEERGRIAREMHDGLAQVLGYLNLQVQTLQALLDQGKLEKVRTKLSQMEQAVQVAHADVREDILSLRTTLANKKGMILSMSDYVSEFAIQTKIDAHFRSEVKEESNLASVAEVQLVCILHEALSNVRKHSHATHVNVSLCCTGQPGKEQICLRVRDDGSGFQTSESKRSFGLQTMRERAESVKGYLFIHSVPGEGTEIECGLPCLSPEQSPRPSLVFP